MWPERCLWQSVQMIKEPSRTMAVRLSRGPPQPCFTKAGILATRLLLNILTPCPGYKD